MVTLQQAAPSLPLKPFIKLYKFLEFDAENLQEQRWYASADPYLIFFLEDNPFYIKCQNQKFPIQRNCDIVFVGISTQFNGWFQLKGKYKCFLIHFTPTGLTRLFKLPLDKIINNIYPVNGFLDSSADLLFKRLKTASQIEQMASLADAFLIPFLKNIKSKSGENDISVLSNNFPQLKIFWRTQDYANILNMSLRNFERTFLEQAGIAFKTYLRLLRFQKAIFLKVNFPEKSLSSIAYECGYYDQTHMGKDFKEFTNVSPSLFFKDDPFIQLQIYSSRIN